MAGQDEQSDAQMLDLEQRKLEIEADLNDPITLVDRVYQIWWHWADFHIQVISPSFDAISPPALIEPETITGTDELEYVYVIHDQGYKLSTSKGEELFFSGKAMCKMYYTIEKMISILIERLQEGGIDKETEVQVAFAGHQLAQRKAFESIINLSWNVVVTNFDPGSWGERYLQTVKRIADKGGGYPTEAPRQPYKVPHGNTGASSTAKR
jgi:hypothetical protein